MIEITESKTADSRTCDVTKVTKDQLLASSHQHIGDLEKGLGLFKLMLDRSAARHDVDKITDIEGFYKDFTTSFKDPKWYPKHLKLNRHHLNDEAGVPADVNLIDVLDMIADCVMAGLGRSGKVTALTIKPEVLMTAFKNTAALLEANITVIKDKSKNQNG